MTTIFLPLFLLLQAFVSDVESFRWLNGSLESGATVLACLGSDQNLTWAYADRPAEHDIDEEWAFFRRNEAVATELAAVFHGRFLVEDGIHQHMQYLPPSGIRLLNVTTEDDGIYRFRVKINLDNHISSHETNISLLVIDPQVADGKLMVLRQMPDLVYDNATKEFHVQMACAPNLPLGNMPIHVEFVLPDAKVLPATGFENGQFTVSLPNPVQEGDYGCRISNPDVTCLPADALLLQEAAKYVNGCQAQLQVTNRTLEALTLELQQERQALRDCRLTLNGRAP